MSPEGVGLHVEIQQAPVSDMAWRMADYAVRLREVPTARSRLTGLVQVVVQVTGPAMVVLYLAPELATTTIEEIRRLGMTDLVAELRQSDFGRELLAEGREEGERLMLMALLSTRFPAADASRLERTAARLLAAGPRTAASAALGLSKLDEV